MNKGFFSILLLVLSNSFMTLAWYGHLHWKGKLGVFERMGIFGVILLSWCIAFFEYMLMVPANRIGHTVLSVAQLKIIQEVITLTIFVPFALLYLKEPFKMDFIYAGLCLLGAVYFMFRA